MSEIHFDTPWRRMATALYKPASDGRTYGSIDLDMTKALIFIQEKKKEGWPITVTHVVARALAKTLEIDVPEINVFVKRGKVYTRGSVDVFLAVSIDGKSEMGGFTVKDAGNKRLEDIVNEIKDRVERTRNREETGVTKNKYLLAKIPWPFRRPIFLFMKWIVVTLGIDLKFLKFSASSFGSFLITNLGTHGLQYGFPALMPASNLTMVFSIGKIEKKPVVRNDEIVIRDMMPLVAVLDHRTIDGAQGGKVAFALSKYLQEPELL